MSVNPNERWYNPSQCRRAAFLLVLVVVIWGVTRPVMSIGPDCVPPIFFGALRMFAGAALMFVLTAAAARFIVPARRDRGIVVSAGPLRMAIPTALMHFSLSFVDAGRASLPAFTHPVWIAPAAVFLLHEPLDRGAAGGPVLGTGGLPVPFNPFGFDWSDPDTVIGDGLPIPSAMSWAAGILHARARDRRAAPLPLGPWRMPPAGIVLPALSPVREDAGRTV